MVCSHGKRPDRATRLIEHRMSARGVLALALLCAALLCACSANRSAPRIMAIEPSSPEPGTLMLVLGDGLEPVAGVRLGNRELQGFTPVNAGLLAMMVPSDFAEGVATLEVRLGGGARAIAYVHITPSSPAVAAPTTTPNAPPPAADSRPSEAPGQVATTPPQVVRPPAAPPRPPITAPGRDKDKDDDRGNKRGRSGRDDDDDDD
jgi:hypothetical protein